jgi:hypothetical protein
VPALLAEVISPTFFYCTWLHCGCSFPPKPEFAEFNWSAPEFGFASANYPEKTLHSRLLE